MKRFIWLKLHISYSEIHVSGEWGQNTINQDTLMVVGILCAKRFLKIDIVWNTHRELVFDDYFVQILHLSNSLFEKERFLLFYLFFAWMRSMAW